MSIRPEYASSILQGTKRVEFRKRRLASDIRTVMIYVTAPVRLVAGEFEIIEQVVASPELLWERFEETAGITRDGFMSYYSGSGTAVGIVIGQVTTYDPARCLGDVDPGGSSPQSFKYLTP